MIMYVCPNAIRTALPFLMCRLLMKDGADYTKSDVGATAFCAYQHYCPNTRRAENTDNAKKCYEYHLSKG